MKYRYLLITLFLPVLAFSQEFDEDFLKSLPANIKKDFEAQFDKDLETEQQFIPSPETRIDSLEGALDSAKSVLKQIEDELSRNQQVNKNLYKRFGANYFNSFQSTFLPLNEASFNSDYVLDFGDLLNIQITGSEISDTQYRILRNGTIIIPELAPIAVAGLTLEKASDLINTTISESIFGARAYTTIDTMRNINVLIVGQANKPGMYTLSGASTILTLLSAAGGINEVGSYRDIELRRNNKTFQKLDLYDIFTKGDLVFDLQLRSGDVVVVNSKLNEVRVSGSFVNEAIFEIKSGETLGDIFEMADPYGLNDQSTISINRFANNKSTLINLQFSDAFNFKLQNGDSIQAYNIYPSFEDIREVILEGEVKIPGKYFVKKGTTLLDIINQAGGYTSNAYPFAGVYLNQRAAVMQKESKDKSYDMLLRYLVSGPRFSSILPSVGNLVTVLSLLKGYHPTGRLETEFNLSKLEQQQNLNRILEDGDKIIIPPLSNEIHVFGEVMSPGSFLYDASLTTKDYIRIAGNFSKVADSQRIIIVDPNGNTRSISKNYLFFFGSDLPLYPGSTIYVPRQLGKLDGIDLASNVAPIISSVALSLASLNAINNN